MPEERFRFRDDVLRTAAGTTRRRLGLRLLAAAAGVVAFWAFALRGQGAGAGTLAFSLAFLLALAAVSMRRRMRRLHARWGSFEVTIGQDAVERVAAGVPSVRIDRGDVLAVEERPEGLVVQARSGAHLLVPRGVQDFVKARDLLSAWVPPHQ
jgi:hypothetical protein